MAAARDPAAWEGMEHFSVPEERRRRMGLRRTEELCGITAERGLVRRDGRATPVGPTPVCTQLTWCPQEGVPERVVTHCVSEVVGGDERTVGPASRG